MPLSIFKRLGVKTLKPTPMTLQFADRTVKRPLGIAENIIVQLKDSYVPYDFVVFDMKTDEQIPLILGRTFLATAKGSADFENAKITFHVNGKAVEFDCSRSHKFGDDEYVESIREFESIREEDELEEILEEYPREFEKFKHWTNCMFDTNAQFSTNKSSSKDSYEFEIFESLDSNLKDKFEDDETSYPSSKMRDVNLSHS